ncbi:TPT-domain-containing protein [Meredithblackwellia eburnea MCA 4105]
MASNDIKLPIFTSESEDPSQKKGLLGSDEPTGKNATSAVSAEQPKKIWPGYIIMIWIALSSSVILQNAYILRELKFNYPIWLTTFHLLYATAGTRVLLRFTNLLDGLKNVDMSWDRWLKNIVPIGALFSASLIFNNLAYLTLSVSFIQMIKAFTSVAVLTMSVLAGLDKFNSRTATVVTAISCGVALAAWGEINFAIDGFLYQVFGIMFEATRLVAIQKLLQGLRMDPLVSLYYYAPVCAGINCLLIPIYEGWGPFENVVELVGIPLLITNATTALLLNIAVVFLIGAASSLVLTLSGVIKDILLVVGSVVIMGSTVTFTQVIGYGIALAGLVVFKTPPEVLNAYIVRFKAAMGSR